MREEDLRMLKEQRPRGGDARAKRLQLLPKRASRVNSRDEHGVASELLHGAVDRKYLEAIDSRSLHRRVVIRQGTGLDASAMESCERDAAQTSRSAKNQRRRVRATRLALEQVARASLEDARRYRKRFGEGLLRGVGHALNPREPERSCSPGTPCGPGKAKDPRAVWIPSSHRAAALTRRVAPALRLLAHGLRRRLARRSRELLEPGHARSPDQRFARWAGRTRPRLFARLEVEARWCRLPQRASRSNSSAMCGWRHIRGCSPRRT